MADKFTPIERRRLMARIATKNTAPEKKLKKILALPRFGRISAENSKLPGKPDLFLKNRNVAIFAHGCFWHGHGRCRKGKNRPKTNYEFWDKKIAKNKARDRQVRRRLRTLDIKSFTVWECELKNRDAIVKKLDRVLGLANS